MKKDTLHKINTPGMNGSVRNGSQKIILNLEVTDPGSIHYLGQFNDDEINNRALEAVKIGIIAIQSATPVIDTRIVEERFGEFTHFMDACMTDFNKDIGVELDKFFNSENGSLGRDMDSFLGDKGKLGQLLTHYFGGETSHLLTLMSKQLGPGSQFAQTLDPSNKEGVICRIENVVKKYLEIQSGDILGEFSLDVKDSAISRLKASIMGEMNQLKEYNGQFFTELKEAMGFESGKKSESEKGTEKGREFEVALYDHVAAIGRGLGDETQFVGSLVGSVPRCKKGDYVMTLGETSGAPGLNIVAEVKKEMGYKLKDAIDELKEAKKNREATAGIFVFSRSCAPAEVGNFLRVGNDFYITVDDDNLDSPSGTIYFESAYKILRAVIISTARVEETEAVDIDRVRAGVDSAVETVSRINDLITKARTIKNSSIKIEDIALDVKNELEIRLAEILDMIKGRDDSR